MAPHQIIAVAVRLFAIWLVVLIAMNIPYYLLNKPAQVESESVTSFMLVCAFVILLTFGLWKFPLTVANKLLASNAKESKSDVDPDLWLAMGCALMGLWLLATTISSFAHEAIFANTRFGDQYPDELKFWLAGYLPNTIIGFWLLFGAKGFRKLFWWMRRAGRATGSDHTVDRTPD